MKYLDRHCVSCERKEWMCDLKHFVKEDVYGAVQGFLIGGIIGGLLAGIVNLIS